MEKLKKIIDNQPLNTEQFAMACKISPVTLYSMLKGKPCFKSSAFKVIKYLRNKNINTLSIEDFAIAKKK